MPKLRVWWIPQIPMNNPFTVDVPDPLTGKLILDTLGRYDAYQYDNNIKPDYSNAGGLEMFDEADQEWVSWYDDETQEDDLDAYCENLITKQQA